jgi:hypothetical protein
MTKSYFEYYKNGTNEIEIDIVGKRRKSNDITGFRLSASRRIRLSDNVGFSRIRWGSFALVNRYNRHNERVHVHEGQL